MSVEMDRRSFTKMVATASITASIGATVASAEEASPIVADEVLTCDFVIVGGGMSGMSACFEATDRGLDTIIVEQAEVLGGTLFGTEGILGVGSQMQKDAGYEIPEFWSIIEQELHHTNWRTDPLKWSDFIRNSGKDIDFLQAHGGQFDRCDEYKGLSAYPTFHWWVDNNGAAAGATLAEGVANSGARVLTGTTLFELKFEGNDVVGIYCTKADNSILEINAKKTLLACGGAINNLPLIEERSGMDFTDSQCSFEIGQCGVGIELCKKYGGAGGPIAPLCTFTAKDFVYGEKPPIAPIASMQPNCLAVNENGERFMPEDLVLKYHYSLATNVIKSQAGDCWVIHDLPAMQSFESGSGLKLETLGFMVGQQDEGLIAQFEEAAASGNNKVVIAQTVEELAEKIGCAAGALAATIARYNDICTSGVDLDFGKDSEYLEPISSEGPYYALSPVMAFFSTMGGIEVDREFRVLKEDGSVIPNLYASGTGACTLYQETYNYNVSGGQNAYCCYSGRQSAANVAAALA